MIQEVNSLLRYPYWLPKERSQITYYSQQLRSLVKEFHRYQITDQGHISELLIDPTLHILVTRILEYKNVTRLEFFKFEDPPNLAHVGDRLAFEVTHIYEASKQDSTKREKENSDSKHFSTRFLSNSDHNRGSTKACKSKMDVLFDRLFEQVNKLLRYDDWLPFERCQISFYSEKLKYFSEAFATFTITDENFRFQLTESVELSTAIRSILFSKYVTSSDPPDLTRVGDQLALEVAGIYKASNRIVRKTEEWDPPDFSSHFYFEKKYIQEVEAFVGFQAEASDLLQQLVSITKKQLQVICIVGMAGLGKTTLAERLYNDPYVVSYFYARAWITCSQVYNKRDLLLTLVSSVVEITDDVSMMDDNMLAHALYRALKGRRYLIVIDDIWSKEAWDDFQISFPNDINGSKILLTTRIKDVAVHAQPKGNPHCLRFLTEEESFDLFKKKAFIMGYYSGQMYSIGKSIARKCRELPLAIVVIAGLLKTNLQMSWWAQVDEAVSSYILTDENQYIDTLALSYHHLPQHLRPCFLSFGAFPEDHDIPVCKLTWLWIAEGFIQQDGTEKSLEDVAEDYLMNLIGRSLVVVGKKRSNGAIKMCRIHDLLRDLGLKKAEEENFSPDIYWYNKHTYSCPHSLDDSSTKPQLFLSTNVLNIPSNPCCSCWEVSNSSVKDVLVIWDTSKLIRVLDISSIELLAFPCELLQLVQLRYLELRFRSGNPPESVSNLRELQTLVMSSRTNMIVPKNIWKITTLRHLCIKTGENHVSISDVEEEAILMENLYTMSLVSPTRPCQDILARTRNLKKLGLCGPLTTKSGEMKFPDICHLKHLKTLKLLNTTALCKAGRLSDSIIFPETLKSLTVSNTYLDWKEAWIFEMIPNLEVLKLKFHAFVGRDWETSTEAFPRLKLLKLDELNILTWTASRNHFPELQRLQICRCPYLMEIPEDFGNIWTLEWIELSGCSEAATSSARNIQREQESYGNDWLKFLLNPALAPS
ncbi:hypothetical protein ACET3Z_010395 [Daucus carota]